MGHTGVGECGFRADFFGVHTRLIQSAAIGSRGATTLDWGKNSVTDELLPALSALSASANEHGFDVLQSLVRRRHSFAHRAGRGEVGYSDRLPDADRPDLSRGVARMRPP